MGSWGTGIFDDDVALDVRAAFEREIETGTDVSLATHRVLKRFASALQDYDDAPVVYLALAALQLQHNSLQPGIRDKALHIISTGAALGGWDEGAADSPDLAERKQVVDDLRSQLLQWQR